MLLGEVWTSVTLCRDLYMYTGASMRIALHAHAMLATCQPRRVASAVGESKGAEARLARADLTAQLQRRYLGRAYQCSRCAFGPLGRTAAMRTGVVVWVYIYMLVGWLVSDLI